MNKLKHTPVPWVIEASYSELFVVQRRCGNPKFDKLICSLDISRSDLNRTEQAYADACLIAAAPDLLEALESVLEACAPDGHLPPHDCFSSGPKHGDARDKVCVFCEPYKLAKKAIAKATGGE